MKPNYPSSTLEKCKEEFEPLENKSFGTFVSKSVEILEEQQDCAIKHNELIDYIKENE